MAQPKKVMKTMVQQLAVAEDVLPKTDETVAKPESRW
jgi:hypothetical protein